MAFKFFSLFLLSSAALAQNSLRTTDFQQSLNAHAPRNYIKNSGAEKNDSLVTDAGGIVSRTTSTPLEGAGSFAIDATTSGQKAVFTANDFQPGILGGSCEANFVYNGDATLYKAYVTLGGTQVTNDLQLLSPSSSQLVSIIFPCGSSATDDPTLTIEATSNSAAAIKVDSVYLGNALSIGTSAQGELLVSATMSGNQSVSATSDTTIAWNSVASPGFNTGILNTSTGALTLVPGRYSIDVSVILGNPASEIFSIKVKDPSSTVICGGQGNPQNVQGQLTVQACAFDVATSGSYIVTVNSTADTSYEVNQSTSTKLRVWKLPTRSDVVLRPSLTNVLVNATGNPPTGSLTAASATIFGTEVTDTTASYDPSTGAFTAPYSGVFCWNSQVGVGGTESADQVVEYTPYVDGSSLGRGRGVVRVYGSAGGFYTQSNYCTSLERAQVLTFRTNTNISSPSFVGGSTENWLSITAGSQGLPRPYIPGSVFSNSSGIEFVERARLTCSSSSAIVSQSGAWVSSIGNVSGDSCTITLTSGIFSSTPSCQVTRVGASPNMRSIWLDESSATSLSFGCLQRADTSSSDANCTSTTFKLTCSGPR